MIRDDSRYVLEVFRHAITKDYRTLSPFIYLASLLSSSFLLERLRYLIQSCYLFDPFTDMRWSNVTVGTIEIIYLDLKLYFTYLLSRLSKCPIRESEIIDLNATNRKSSVTFFILIVIENRKHVIPLECLSNCSQRLTKASNRIRCRTVKPFMATRTLFSYIP